MPDPSDTLSPQPSTAPAASGAGGSVAPATTASSEHDSASLAALEALKKIVDLRLININALRNHELYATEVNYPVEFQYQLSPTDLTEILENLYKGLSTTLGKQILSLKNGESLYLKRDRDTIEIADDGTGTKKSVTFPRSIQIFKKDDEFEVAIETKTKVSEEFWGKCKKSDFLQGGAFKKVKPSWVLTENGYRKEASITICKERQSMRMFRMPWSELRQDDKDVLEKAIKQSLAKEMEVPNLIRDPAIVMTHGPYFHDGKYGRTVEYRAQYYPWSIHYIGDNQELYFRLLEVYGVRERIALEMIRGVSKMHQLGITHSDIKIENILLSQLGRPAYTDFGFASKVEDKQLVIHGTTFYYAPETILALAKATNWPTYDGRHGRVPQSPKMYPWKRPAVTEFINSGTTELANQYIYKSTANDCWALGLVLLQFYSNRWLYQITETIEDGILLDKVIREEGKYTGHPSIDEIITAVIVPLLRVDPKTRMTSADAYKTLKGILQERDIEPFTTPEQPASACDTPTATEVGGAAYTPAAEATRATGQLPDVAGDAAAREIGPATRAQAACLA